MGKEWKVSRCIWCVTSIVYFAGVHDKLCGAGTNHPTLMHLIRTLKAPGSHYVWWEAYSAVQPLHFCFGSNLDREMTTLTEGDPPGQYFDGSTVKQCCLRKQLSARVIGNHQAVLHRGKIINSTVKVTLSTTWIRILCLTVLIYINGIFFKTLGLQSYSCRSISHIPKLLGLWVFGDLMALTEIFTALFWASLLNTVKNKMHLNYT
jgi:hypothetical protein